jgi:hypothetical protein
MMSMKKKRIIGDKGLQVLALLFKAIRQSAARFDQNVAVRRVAGQAPPTVVA